jgi:hypothetical protein
MHELVLENALERFETISTNDAAHGDTTIHIAESLTQEYRRNGDFELLPVRPGARTDLSMDRLPGAARHSLGDAELEPPFAEELRQAAFEEFFVVELEEKGQVVMREAVEVGTARGRLEEEALVDAFDAGREVGLRARFGFFDLWKR